VDKMNSTSGGGTKPGKKKSILILAGENLRGVWGGDQQFSVKMEKYEKLGREKEKGENHHQLDKDILGKREERMREGFREGKCIHNGPETCAFFVRYEGKKIH